MGRPAASALAVLVLVGACSSAAPSASTPAATTTPVPSATPAASATPTASPTPSPTPVAADVSEPFVAIISDPAFAADADVSGTMTIGGVDGTVNGVASFSGPDSSTSLTMSIAGQQQVSESVELGDGAWERKSPGPWLAVKPSKSSMAAYLDGLTEVVDLGIVDLAGTSYHHIQPAGGNELSPDVTGFDVAGAKDAAFTIDFYATDDGTPAVIAMGGAWTQTSSDQELVIEVGVAYTLSPFTGPIEPPTDVWEVYTSKSFGYKMAHPAGWTVKASKTQDVYSVDGQPYVYVVPQSIPKSMGTPGFVTAIKADYKGQFGDPIVDTPTTLGGEVAQRLIYRFTNADGMDVTVADDVTTHAKQGWEVFIATGGGDEDVAFFDTFVATFEFTD